MNFQQDVLLILITLCAGAAAFIFMPSQQSSKKNLLIIAAIIFATIAILFAKNIIVFFALIIFVLSLLFLAMSSNPSARRVLTIYIICAILISVSAILFFKASATIIFYILLLPILGLFPFQSWYIVLFETAPFGIIAAFIAFQGMLVLAGESLFKLENFAILQWLLAASTLVSALFAVIQNRSRKLLAYLMASQLGFLAFAHLTTLPTMNLGSVYMTLSVIGASTTFIMLISAIEMRKRDISLFAPSGCYESYPRLTFWLLIFGLISCGLPLSVGYIAEDLIFEGSLQTSPIIDGMYLLAIAINTILVMKIFLFLCQGKKGQERGLDLRKREIIALRVILAMLVLTATILV